MKLKIMALVLLTSGSAFCTDKAVCYDRDLNNNFLTLNGVEITLNTKCDLKKPFSVTNLSSESYYMVCCIWRLGQVGLNEHLTDNN